MKYFLYALYVVVLIISNLHAQELKPLEIAEKYTGKDITGIYKYLCCEMLEKKVELTGEENLARDSLYKVWGIGEMQNPSIKLSLVTQNDTNAVVSVNYREDTLSEDHYFYFINDDGWKMEAMRTFGFSGLQMMFLNENKNLSEAQILLRKRMGFWESTEFLEKTTLLLLKNDSTLISYFKENREKFNEMLKIVKMNIPQDSAYDSLKTTVSPL